MTAASNVLGTRPDVATITAAAHAVGALAYVDGVHATPHVPVDVLLQDQPPCLGEDAGSTLFPGAFPNATIPLQYDHFDEPVQKRRRTVWRLASSVRAVPTNSAEIATHARSHSP